MIFLVGSHDTSLIWLTPAGGPGPPDDDVRTRLRFRNVAAGPGFEPFVSAALCVLLTAAGIACCCLGPSSLCDSAPSSQPRSPPALTQLPPGADHARAGKPSSCAQPRSRTQQTSSQTAMRWTAGRRAASRSAQPRSRHRWRAPLRSRPTLTKTRGASLFFIS